MPVTTARSKLIREIVEEHNVAAAVSLARRCGVDRVTDLLKVVHPTGKPSVETVDCVCDGITLLLELRSKSDRPTIEIEVPTTKGKP